MEKGYVLDFSNRTIEEFFEKEFQIEFYDPRFNGGGTSKAKILREILDTAPLAITGQILRKLWDYRDTLDTIYKGCDPDEEKTLRDNYFSAIAELEGEEVSADLEAFTLHSISDETLGTLLEAIQRDIRDDKYPEAMDRVHTYCVKKFRFLLQEHGEKSEKSEPLHSLVGKYSKVLEKNNSAEEISLQILRMNICVFQKFNSVRNDKSLAHDNHALLDASNARFVFDTISAVLRFIKSIDSNYGS
ncbi:abortive infection family protein [Celeribacter litoreus]|uniref:abortive infection family protein n=1 Tax=Celeribacter litoreus TaxID=2876714 RepID=UPI001CCFB745|nr:abortive infection family protein [Celeribacter litoreus]MCA0042987.1 abortive infection family protein [Celeribacter litoreus]